MSSFSLDRFLHACGAAGPLRLVVEHGGAAETYVLPQPFALAGGDPRADIRPGGGSLPRRCAYLQVLGGRLLGLNLAAGPGGRKGTYPPHQWLDPGGAWACGPLTIRPVADGPGVPAAATAPDGRGGPPRVTVDITGATSGTCEYAVKVPLILIGKSPQCQVRLRDSAVSRFHCALVNTPDGLWAVDLLGRGGITVNGSVARVARLDGGDELRLGGFVLRPRGSPPPGDTPAGPPTTDAVVAALERFTMPSLPLPAPAQDWSAAVPAAGGNPSDSTLAPVIGMFAEFQRQMAEQFRLTMTGMLDMFRQMHGDQMQTVWRELAEIRRLNEEVTSLKATLAQLPANGPTRPAPPPPAAPAPVPAAKPEPAAPAPPVANGPPPAPAHPIPPRTVPTPPPDAAKADRDPAELHAWLSRRIGEVQREREGRWQKVLSFLKGTPGR